MEIKQLTQIKASMCPFAGKYKKTLIQKNLKILSACSYHCLKAVPRSVVQGFKNKCTHSKFASHYLIAIAF